MPHPTTAPLASAPLTCMALHDGVVYGPLRSRRFGTSLGINLLPPNRKLCSFNCVYCQYGWTDNTPVPAGAWPIVADVTRAVEAAAERARVDRVVVDRWTLAGHGEPTLHPDFADVVDELCALRDRVAPATPIGILSNSTTAHVASVRAALARLDDRGMKLDAGTQDDLRHVNATSFPLAQIVAGLAALPDLTLQAMFVRDARGRVDNAAPAAVTAWLAAVSRIAPREVQIYTLARHPAWHQLEAVPHARLDEIARAVRDLGIPASVFA